MSKPRPSTAVGKKTATAASVQNSEKKDPTKSVMSSKVENMVMAQKSTLQETYAPAVAESGAQGSGEELAMTLEKVVSQLEIITRTLNVLEQRVSQNEESVSGAVEYFRQIKEERLSAQNQAF